MLKLSSGNSSADISQMGAWVETLSLHNVPIFFPKSELTTKAGGAKARGGMHVCLPNFGPGGDSELPQHGFGRTLTWIILQQNDSSASLELRVTEGAYAGLVAQVVYRLEEDSFTATLSLTNEGASVLRVAPGFHPYFALDADETAFSVNGATYQLEELDDAKYVTFDTAEIVLANKQVNVTQENLTTWAIWTDQLGSYVCVEPTFGGNCFLETEQSDEKLMPGQTRMHSVRISW